MAMECGICNVIKTVAQYILSLINELQGQRHIQNSKERMWNVCVLPRSKGLQFVFLLLSFKENYAQHFLLCRFHKKAKQLTFLSIYKIYQKYR
jgi:hypothetical protein